MTDWTICKSTFTADKSGWEEKNIFNTVNVFLTSAQTVANPEHSAAGPWTPLMWKGQ